jgi:hypothetical protein
MHRRTPRTAASKPEMVDNAVEKTRPYTNWIALQET